MKVWVVVEQEWYEVGPPEVIGAFSTKQLADEAAADNPSRTVHEVTVDAT